MPITPTPPGDDRPVPSVVVTRGARRAADRQAAEALRQHRAGAVAEAERQYRAVLQTQPDHAESLNGLAMLARDAGRADLAIAFAGRAVAARPADAHLYITLGLALRDLGHAEEARAALQVAVLRDPADPRAHVAFGLALETLGRSTEAEAAANRAIALDRRAGRPDAASSGAWALVGRARAAAGQTGDAIAALTNAVAEQPDDVASWHLLGAALGGVGRLDEAEAAFRRTVALRPDDPAALANLGGLLFERNRLDEAKAQLQRAVQLGTPPAAAPTAATRSNLGLILMAEGALQEAEQQLAQAAAIAPGEDGILVNQGSVLVDLGRLDEASACFERVLARAPEGSGHAIRARFNRATVRLARGEAAAGWADFEARLPLVAAPPYELPGWTGEPIGEGHRLLVHAEQGLGDAIQFLRYVPAAAARAGIVLVLPDALLRVGAGLASRRCHVVSATAPDPELIRGCVARASLLSLPHLLGLPVPPASPELVLAADDVDRWREWLATLPGLKVGLSWAGSPGYRFDRRRSLHLSWLAPLARARGISFVSLQQGEAANDPVPDGLTLHALPAALADLADTAALIAQLDLVVSVDTAIVHLAGTLGRPVWLLNRYGGDWRWQDGFQTQGGGSLWYPSLQQFRQLVPVAPRDAWKAPIQAVATALDELPG